LGCLPCPAVRVVVLIVVVWCVVVLGNQGFDPATAAGMIAAVGITLQESGRQPLSSRRRESR
jgi:hypothetical protein